MTQGLRRVMRWGARVWGRLSRVGWRMMSLLGRMMSFAWVMITLWFRHLLKLGTFALDEVIT